MSDLDLVAKKEPKVRCVVRLSTTAWMDGGAIHLKKRLSILKRKSTERGIIWIGEDVANIGADEVLRQFVNLHECRDGIYEIELTNVLRDWETGHIDDYDYKLIPYV